MKEHGLKHFRILVADDDSSILDLFQQVISRVETDHMVHPEVEGLKFDIETCQQGDEAVDAVKSSLKEGRPFSVAFIDIRMLPGPDGIRAAEHIRALDPNIEIVIVTGYSDTHPRDIARRVPPTHKLMYLQKPFHSREIYQFASALSMKWHNEKELMQHKSSLEKVNRELMETNQALSVLARNIDRDKEFLEKKIYETISVNIMPIIKELQKDTNCQKRQADLEVLTTYLNSLISGPTDHHDIIISLTDQEMRVAVMIKNSLTSQKIANMLHISLHTVKTHRKNIRKKLNIHNSTVNLASYLKSKMVSDSM